MDRINRGFSARIKIVIAVAAVVCATVSLAGVPKPAAAWGSSWSVVPSPNGTLSGVSCTSAKACTAVGYSDNGTLAERWNGMSWAVQTTPNPAGGYGSVLSGVSCTAPKACTAVGHYLRTVGPELTLAERWNGTLWAIQSTPNPAGGYGSVLSGVLCTAPKACTAVGYYVKPGSRVTLAERWNGTSWAVQMTPNPTGAHVSVLSGVSCPAPKVCTAVGYSDNGTLAERWNGTSWAVQTTSNPAGVHGIVLSGVSCTSAKACTAVGGYYRERVGMDVTLAERWNGALWAIQSTPNPAGAHSVVLSGVSCASATACTVVGNYYNIGGPDVTLAERWNGTSWAVRTTPNPGGAQGSTVLSGVSCTAPKACTAVGYYYHKSAGPELTLAERWNGTSWAVRTTPNPAGALAAIVVAVTEVPKSTIGW
jgi:hypothetical protein